MPATVIMTPFQQTITASQAALESLRQLEGSFDQAVRLTVGCLSAGHKLLICGNGGSAADASHLATEFVVRFMQDRRPLPAISLTDAGSTLTAAGNDYGFDELFARQVAALGQTDDLLIAMSTSGKSSNIIQALKRARDIGVRTITLLGRDGGDAKGLADVELVVPQEHTARIQEAHHMLIHALCEQTEAALLT